MWSLDEEGYKKRILNPAVEQFKTTGGVLPDPFARYDLHLDVADAADIALALRTVKSFWDRERSRNPKYQKLIECLVQPGEHERLSRVLVDPKARGELRAEVEQRRQDEANARFAELDEYIHMVSAKGYLTAKERETIVQQFGRKGLTAADITSRIPVPVKAPEVAPRIDEGLNKVVRDQIRNNLSYLQKRDLYEFLDVSPDCSREALKKRLEQVEETWAKRNVGHDKSAAQVLIGFVKSELVDGDRARYDKAREYEVYEKLRPMVEVAAIDGAIDEETEYPSLLRKAAELGLSEAAGRALIMGIAMELGLRPPSQPVAESILCPKCRMLMPKSGAGDCCTRCGTALWVECPECRQRFSASGACPRCGLTARELHHVRRALREAEMALSEGRLDDTLVCVEDAEAGSCLGSEVQSVRSRLEERRNAARLRGKAVEEALESRKLRTARRLLAGGAADCLPSQLPNGKTVQQVIADLEARLAHVEELIRLGRVAEGAGKPEDAAFQYSEALAISSDAEEAEEGLRRCPPAPAVSAVATVIGDAVRVQWQRAGAVGHVEYLVVRRSVRPALSPEQGATVSRVQGTSWLDESPDIGEALYYSVFTVRGDSRSSAATAAEVFVTPEVRDLTLAPGDREVRGRWSTPRGKVSVRVRRAAGRPPTSSLDGVEVRTIGGSSFVDRGIENGQLVFYHVSCEYLRASGPAVATPGVTASCCPEPPLTSVEDLAIAAESGKLRIAWTAPRYGSVSVYRMERLLESDVGSRFSMPELARFGTPLAGVCDNIAFDCPVPEAAVFYVPITLGENGGVLGRARQFIPIKDVARLRADDFGSYIQLTWEWPANCLKALVAWRADSYPCGAADPAAQRRLVTRGEYTKDGGFRLMQPQASPHHFAVYSLAEAGGENAFSCGTHAEVRVALSPTITYRFERPLFQRKHVVVLLSSIEGVERVPDLALVARTGDLPPLKPEDGIQVARLSGVRLRRGEEARQLVDLSSVSLPASLRLFVVDSMSGSCRLQDPAPAARKVK